MNDLFLEEKIESSFLSKENSIDIITKDAFRTADKDNKGYIDINEFEICLKDLSESLGTKKPNKENIISEFERFDIDDNGKLDFDEFKKFVKEIINKMFLL